MSIDHIFVYGTLRRAASRSRHDLLQPATLIGRGTFQGRLYDLGDYPGVVASDDPADLVHGEIHRLHDPAATLARLDRYEGCDESAATPTEYVRAVADIRLPAGGSVHAYVYVYQRSLAGLRRIDSGDYLDAGGKLI